MRLLAQHRYRVPTGNNSTRRQNGRYEVHGRCDMHLEQEAASTCLHDAPNKGAGSCDDKVPGPSTPVRASDGETQHGHPFMLKHATTLRAAIAWHVQHLPRCGQGAYLPPSRSLPSQQVLLTALGVEDAGVQEYVHYIDAPYGVQAFVPTVHVRWQVRNMALVAAFALRRVRIGAGNTVDACARIWMPTNHGAVGAIAITIVSAVAAADHFPGQGDDACAGDVPSHRRALPSSTALLAPGDS
ncbi:hypothetical protein DCS_01114 [Drechmeria coniospora]|uniref:Uncharacterized protein n=1 Tax=Drechmeria coniospora TaxID=98403 RepID=A0A151GSC2_DRECN|nr:hypothetical protein DCS_01114 [Drechmeria coniospora]KYK59980.1 hypothetical protein DCS_01114 [Drechmeria coniospora]